MFQHQMLDLVQDYHDEREQFHEPDLVPSQFLLFYEYEMDRHDKNAQKGDRDR